MTERELVHPSSPDNHFHLRTIVTQGPSSSPHSVCSFVAHDEGDDEGGEDDGDDDWMQNHDGRRRVSRRVSIPSYTQIP